MADSSSGNPDPGYVAPHKVWTFIIKGGEEFTLTLPNTPALVHSGGMTVWQMAATKAVADAAEVLILDTGAAVEKHADSQSDEQTKERRSLMGL